MNRGMPPPPMFRPASGGLPLLGKPGTTGPFFLGPNPPAPGAPGMPTTYPIMAEVAPGGPPMPAQTGYGPPGFMPSNTTAKIGAHIPLAKCRVLYIGSAVPTETSEGLKAVQEPLNKRYVTDGKSASSVPGVDAWLTVFSSGLLLQYVTDKNDSKNHFVTWLPIHTLHVSAAVKCIPQMRANGERYCEFVALDSPAAGRSDHPPIFCTIMRRTKGVKVLECHGFICKTNSAAMALVESSTHAYEHKEGWMEDEDPKLLQTLEASLDTQNADAEPTLPLFQPSSDTSRDRPNMKANGYFLLLENNNKMIKSYNVQHPNRAKSRQNPEPAPQPIPIPMEPQPIPMEPQAAGMYVPAPSEYLMPAQYLSDFRTQQPYAVWEFPGFVSPEQYKATVRERRRPREPVGFASYDRANPSTLPPARIYPELPPPRPQPVMEQPYYLQPSKYDYRDDMGNQYYLGGEDPNPYRGYFPDDLAYIAMPPPGDTGEYARFIAPAMPSARIPDPNQRNYYQDGRIYDDRYFDDRRVDEGYYEDRRHNDRRYDDRRYEERRDGRVTYDDFGNVAGFYP